MEAAMTLASIGDESAPAIPKLTEMVNDKELGVRVAAVYALGTLGPKAKSAVAALEPGLKSKDVFLATFTTWALARIEAGNKEYLTKLKQEMLPSLFEAVKDKNRKVRIAAVRAIHELKPGSEVTIPAFTRIVQNADPKTIKDVMEAIATLGDKAVPGLINGLKVKAVRGHAAETLGRIGQAAAPAVPALIEAMEDERPDVRREILFALGNIGPEAKAAVGVARKSLADEDQTVKYSAVWMLGRVGPAAAEALPELEKDVCNTDDPYFGNVCAWAMIRIDAKNEKRIKEAMPVLLKGLENENAFVRSEAASTLGMIGPPAKEALEALKKAALDKDEHVAKSAADAIAKISGQPTASK
jgi:HEAT repeat protein